MLGSCTTRSDFALFCCNCCYCWSSRSPRSPAGTTKDFRKYSWRNWRPSLHENPNIIFLFFSVRLALVSLLLKKVRRCISCISSPPRVFRISPASVALLVSVVACLILSFINGWGRLSGVRCSQSPLSNSRSYPVPAASLPPPLSLRPRTAMRSLRAPSRRSKGVAFADAPYLVYLPDVYSVYSIYKSVCCCVSKKLFDISFFLYFY